MMATFVYNDQAFSLLATGNAWDITRNMTDGGTAQVGTGLFRGLSADEAFLRARTLVKSIYPVGIKVVGPDVTHPALIGDLKIIGPNVAHPNFINWDKDSTSFQSDRHINKPLQDKS